MLTKSAIEYVLPKDLQTLVANVEKELRKQNADTLTLRYLRQNTTKDAKNPERTRAGRQAHLLTDCFITHDGTKYQIGTFRGNPSNGSFQEYSFDPFFGLLEIPLEHKEAVAFAILCPMTKDSPFSSERNGEPTYEIYNAIREKMIVEYETELNRFTEFFIDKKLWGKDWLNIASAFSITDLTNIKAAKKQLTNLIYQNKEGRSVYDTLRITSDLFDDFDKTVVEPVYTGEYLLEVNQPSQEEMQNGEAEVTSIWRDSEGEEVAKVGEYDMSVFISLANYVSKKVTKKANEIFEVNETSKTPPANNSKTPPKK